MEDIENMPACQLCLKVSNSSIMSLSGDQDPSGEMYKIALNYFSPKVIIILSVCIY